MKVDVVKMVKNVYGSETWTIDYDKEFADFVKIKYKVR